MVRMITMNQVYFGVLWLPFWSFWDVLTVTFLKGRQSGVSLVWGCVKMWGSNSTFNLHCFGFFFLFNPFFCLFLGEATKFGRNDSSSPAPPTSLSTAGVQSQPQQAPQAGTQGQGQGQSPAQQTQSQAFLNPPLPPGYGYTGKRTLFCLKNAWMNNLSHLPFNGSCTFRNWTQSIYF